MKRFTALLAAFASGIATAGEPSSAQREPLPSSLPELTTDICNIQLPKWQAELKHIEHGMLETKAAHDANPSPDSETATLASVDAFVKAMEMMAPIEYRCSELMTTGARTPDGR